MPPRFHSTFQLALALVCLLIPATAWAAGPSASPDTLLPSMGVVGLALATRRSERQRAERLERDRLQALHSDAR